jgi:hypothetical protein
LTEPKPVLSDQEVAYIYRATGKFPVSHIPGALEQPAPQSASEPFAKSAENDQQPPSPEKPLPRLEKTEEGPSPKKLSRSQEINKRMEEYRRKNPGRDFGRER